MKNVNSVSGLFFIGLNLLVIANSAAQKLPNVQKISVRAPQTIRIDGKATEWDNKLQANNKATDIVYTLSNDDNSLYLIVQSKYHDVVDKILRGGLTLTINHTLKKKDAKRVTITYPVLRDADLSTVSNMYARAKNHLEGDDNQATFDNLNKLLGTKDKTINVSGIESIADPSIAIYNDLGIKAASLFDDKLTYTCEIAIPLRYLNLPNNGMETFSYQIKVNEPAEIHRPTDGGTMAPPPPPVPMATLATTDFWGEYKLAKE